MAHHPVHLCLATENQVWSLLVQQNLNEWRRKMTFTLIILNSEMINVKHNLQGYNSDLAHMLEQCLGYKQTLN